jgi:hypothetical protein
MCRLQGGRRSRLTVQEGRRRWRLESREVDLGSGETTSAGRQSAASHMHGQSRLKNNGEEGTAAHNHSRGPATAGMGILGMAACAVLDLAGVAGRELTVLDHGPSKVSSRTVQVG